jgi:hypothetical protein
MAEPVPTDTVLKLSREDRKPKDPGIEVPFIQRRGRIPAFPPPHHSKPTLRLSGYRRRFYGKKAGPNQLSLFTLDGG